MYFKDSPESIRCCGDCLAPNIRDGTRWRLLYKLRRFPWAAADIHSSCSSPTPSFLRRHSCSANLLPVRLERSGSFLGCLFCSPSQEADFKFHPGYQPDSGDCKPTTTLRLEGRASSLAVLATGCQSRVRRAPRGLPEGWGDLLLRAWLDSRGAAASGSPSHCGCSKVVVRGLLPEQWWVLCMESLCTRRWIEHKLWAT